MLPTTLIVKDAEVYGEIFGGDRTARGLSKNEALLSHSYIGVQR